jgi:nucleotide-binding universal stress UspA family protein
MIALKKVLLATDFSECAKAAEEYASAFADQFQAELHVLHVVVDIGLMTAEYANPLALAPDYLDQIKRQAKCSIDKIMAESVKRGGIGISAIRIGNVPLEIVKYASEKSIDLIVIGTHGRGGFMHLLLGSCAEKVVRKAQCPVLTVRPVGHQFTSARLEADSRRTDCVSVV